VVNLLRRFSAGYTVRITVRRSKPNVFLENGDFMTSSVERSIMERVDTVGNEQELNNNYKPIENSDSLEKEQFQKHSQRRSVTKFTSFRRKFLRKIKDENRAPSLPSLVQNDEENHENFIDEKSSTLANRKSKNKLEENEGKSHSKF